MAAASHSVFGNFCRLDCLLPTAFLCPSAMHTLTARFETISDLTRFVTFIEAKQFEIVARQILLSCLLAACRTFRAGCVAAKRGWMQDAPRRQGPSPCQVVQRRRRPV